MKILIIEDEEPASERIVAMVREFDPAIHILATLRSVKDSLEWLKNHAAPDLILVDIQLNDGVSFDIFKTNPVPSPLIFTTAYDEYLIKAFEFNSIDYLLKPIRKEKLHNALSKFLKLKGHIMGNLVSLFDQLRNGSISSPQRLIVKKEPISSLLKLTMLLTFIPNIKSSSLSTMSVNDISSINLSRNLKANLIKHYSSV